MKNQKVKLRVINGRAFVTLTLPMSATTLRLKHKQSAVYDMGHLYECSLIEVQPDMNEQQCILKIPVNPFADTQIEERMVLLQQLAKRAICYEPAFDITNLGEVQHEVLLQ